MASAESIYAREGVERVMEKMNIREKESSRLVVDDQEDDEALPKWALMGKVLHRRVLHVNTMADALRPARGNPKGLTFNSVGKNLFIAYLEGHRD